MARSKPELAEPIIDDSELDGGSGIDTPGGSYGVDDSIGKPATDIGSAAESGDDELDPSSGIGDGATKRASGNGRKSSDTSGGTRKRAEKPPQKLDIKSAGNKVLATQLVGLHAIAGVVTGQPMLCAITQEQAESMVLAINDVMSQYKIKPNPKVIAWCNLAGVMTIVYAPKVLAVRSVLKTRNQATPRATVTPADAAGGATSLQFG